MTMLDGQIEVYSALERQRVPGWVSRSTGPSYAYGENVENHGAKCDYNPFTGAGSDDTVPVRAALAALDATATGGELIVPRPTLVRETNGSAGQILLSNKPNHLRGLGPLAGFYASTDTPTSVPILRYKPLDYPHNEGFSMEGITLASAFARMNPNNAGEWACVGGESGGHCLVFDDTAAPAYAPISCARIHKCKFLPTGGLAFYATGANGNGNPTQTDFLAPLLIYNGMKFDFMGDSVGILGRVKMIGKNYAVEATQSVGATMFVIDGANMTAPRGILLKGGFYRGSIRNVIAETYKSSAQYGDDGLFGADGAVISLRGDALRPIEFFSLENNTMSSLDGGTFGSVPPHFKATNLDGVYVGHCVRAIFTDNAHNQHNSAKRGMRISANAVNTKINDFYLKGADVVGYEDLGLATDWDVISRVGAPPARPGSISLDGVSTKALTVDVDASGKQAAFTLASNSPFSIPVSAAAGNFNVTIPQSAPVFAKGRIFCFFNYGATGTVTLAFQSGDQLLDGNTMYTNYPLAPGARVFIQFNGSTVWYVVA